MYKGSYASRAHRAALSDKVNEIMRSLPAKARRSATDHRRKSTATHARVERERLANEQLSFL